jgi:RNA polymerase sigma-70 factor, ECF subfamily
LYDFARHQRIQGVQSSSEVWRAGGTRRVSSTARPAERLTAISLCNGYATRVYRFAAMLARGEVEAEDLAQIALERAVRKLDRFDPGRGSVEAWLWRIVVNAARDEGRLARRRFALWERIRSNEPPPGSVESDALRRLDDAALLAAVRELPKRDRAMIALRFGAGLDHAAVGAALGISPGAATIGVRRALDRLRARLRS